MKRQALNLSSAALALHISSILIATETRSAHAENSCDQAIEFIKTDAALRIGGSITYLEFRRIDDSPFNNADEQLIVGLGNLSHNASESQRQANRNILKSPRLLHAYSERIIASCSKVVNVTYGMEATGGGDGGWYLTKDNQVRREDCVTFPGRGAPDLPWGKTYCW